MKEISYIKRGISLFLAFWMLFTSVGFSVDFHYCEGNLVDWSVFGEAEKCEHGKEKVTEKTCCAKKVEKTSCHEKDTEFNKSDCCSSDNATFQLADNFDINSLKGQVSQPNLIFLTSFIFSTVEKENNVINYYTNSSPPILDKQGLTFIQSFLI